MPIEMPRGLPFSVDTWTSTSKRKRHHFLTHAHKDHSSGISSHFPFPIYCTNFTKTLVLQHYPLLDNSLFVDIEIEKSVVVDDPDGAFTVTAFDANHCIGAVMFLFEGKFGNILHTGDCRLTPECLLNLPERYISKKGKEPQCRLDYVFLDCTFGNFSQSMPSKQSAIQQVINCIWKHPHATTVYLTCDLLGQEEILVSVSQTFGSKIYVDKANNPENFNTLTLTMPEIITEDPYSRFHIFDGFPRLYERAKVKILEAQANLQPEPLIVRPSAQWYACAEDVPDIEFAKKKRMSEAIKDQFGVWHVCYSMHSSKEELEWALQLLAPKWIVSTTPSCRAVELDYVRKHYLNSKVVLNCIWKLLDMSTETDSEAEASVKSKACSPLVEGESETNLDGKLPVKQTNENNVLINLSPPAPSLPSTLFGQARLDHQDNNYSQESEVLSKSEETLRPGKDAEEKSEMPEDCKRDLDATEVKSQEPVHSETGGVHESFPYSRIGSSKGFSERFRKVYRSMNVPVPQPLPSLFELLNSSKRAKRNLSAI